MEKDHILNGIIPRPVRVTGNKDKLLAKAINSIHTPS